MNLCGIFYIFSTTYKFIFSSNPKGSGMNFAGSGDEEVAVAAVDLDLVASPAEVLELSSAQLSCHNEGKVRILS